MKELQGKYGNAKVFTDLIEQKAIEQITTLLDQEFISGSQIRIMPDVHSGAGCTIGTTMTIKDKCCPNLVGVDIGCGMHVTTLGWIDLDLEKLDQVIHKHIPSGFNIRDSVHYNIANTAINELICRDHVNLERAFYSLGTLGGGNHFIEVDKDKNDNLYLVIHTGSRHLGLEVAGYYQKLAEDYVCGKEKDSLKTIIDRMKAEGRHTEIADELKKIKNSSVNIPKELAYVSGKLFDDYIHDMKIVQDYAKWNRITIEHEILYNMGLDPDTYCSFETVHNYIDTDNMILRKGAVSAEKDELLLIPINMRDGGLLCVGKGNPDWNYSAPHGAGRLMSRAEAKKSF